MAFLSFFDWQRFALLGGWYDVPPADATGLGIGEYRGVLWENNRTLSIPNARRRWTRSKSVVIRHLSAMGADGQESKDAVPGK
ncbi:MAG: hypothetical protein ACR2Q4_02565 [Geminicoccaceae bacterium]